MFIDAMVVKGQTKQFLCTIQCLDETGQKFVPMDLSPYNIRISVLGSPTADAQVLVQHILNENTNVETEGQITDSENGEFTFVITDEDTQILGLGNFPIMLELLDYDTNELVYTITQGGLNGEFNKIQIIQV